MLEARAQARYEAEKVEYNAKMQAREEKAAKKGQKTTWATPQTTHTLGYAIKTNTISQTPNRAS